jgi:hypothetical protein
VRTKAVHRDAGIVDNKVDAIAVCLLQVVRQAHSAAAVRDVQFVKLDLRETTIGFQCLCLLQLRILFQVLDCGLASPLVACREIDQEGPVVEWRLWILKRKLADNCKTNALDMLAERVNVSGRVAYLVRSGDDSDPAI